MEFGDLKTPCALVERRRVERNTARMSDRLRALGVRLRPHVKTHKCIEAARLQVRGHAGGITVSTLAEARHFAAAGFRDLTYAFPIAISAIPEAAALQRDVERLSLLLDHEATLDALEAHARDHATRFAVFLKVDCGYHRAGVDPASPRAEALARRLATSPHVEFRGLLTHAGQSYDCRTPDEIRDIAAEERGSVVDFAARLRRAGIEVPEVSVGSTPTMSLAEDLTGVTEARPGNYVFYDAFQAAIGSCTLDDAAFSVLVTVVGHDAAHGRLIVDGGALALSKDPGPTHVDPDCGFGVVCDASGAPLPGLRVAGLSQEHGKLAGSVDGDAVGRRLRIIPNHSCLAAACHDRYHVVDAGRVVGEWCPVRGW